MDGARLAEETRLLENRRAWVQLRQEGGGGEGGSEATRKEATETQ